VVVETFIAMVILAVASGMIVQPNSNPAGYGQLLIGIAAFYGFFVWMAMWAIPRVVRFFNSIENDELFILFTLGIVFLTSGVAAVMNVPPIIGAFFIGMILAENKVTSRIQMKLDSFKDAFVAIFFTSFGMMIDPAMFHEVIWMIVLAIPIVLLYEAFVMSSVSYFLGFSAKASTTIGTSMSGRGIESILYASVGSRVQGTTMGAQLNPFAGAFCFVMSAITPPLVKHSASFANALAKVVPKPLRFSGAVISRTLGKAVMPSNLRIVKGAKMTGVLLASFVVACALTLLTQSYLHIVMTMGGLVLIGLLYYVVRFEIADIAGYVSYSSVGAKSGNSARVVDLVSGVVLGAVLAVLMIVFSWTYTWQFSLVIVLAYVVYVISLMLWAYRGLYLHDSDVPQKVYHLQKATTEPVDAISDIPTPIYGVVRASKHSRL